MDVLNLTICIIFDFEATYFVCCFSYCIISPALSTLAIPCRYVHSCIFHTPIFDRDVLSTPANSINPDICLPERWLFVVNVTECDSGVKKQANVWLLMFQCSRTCSDGVQMRHVACQDDSGVSSTDCDALHRPADNQTCNLGPCPRWNHGDWAAVKHFIRPIALLSICESRVISVL